MRISLNDQQTNYRRAEVLRDIAGKLTDTTPRQPLPEGYKRALEGAFGSCGEGEADRWSGE